MRARFGGFSMFSIVVALVACAPKVLESDSDGASGSTGSTGVVTTGLADYDEMLKCSLDMVCPEHFYHVGEATGHIEGFSEEERCILSGMRDGTPGRYVYGYGYSSANAGGQYRNLIHVHAGREVTFAAHDQGSLLGPSSQWESVDENYPAEHCFLRDAEYFTDCLENHDDDSYYPCTQLKNWWLGCSEMGPRCE